MAQQIRELMTPNPVALPGTASVHEAATAMRDAQIGDVIVIENNEVCGIVTDRDIVVRILADLAKGDWSPQELREHWSLSVGERCLSAKKTPGSQLGFAVLLTCFQPEHRFPRNWREVPRTAVEGLAQPLDVSPA